MVIEGKLGQFEYACHVRRGYGRRIIWKNPPPAGTALHDAYNGAQVEVLRVGLAGKIEYKNPVTGSEGAAYPSDFLEGRS